MDKYGLFPEVDITNNVNVMGNYFSQDTELMKAYSTFEIQIDYLELVTESTKLIQEFLEYMRKANDISLTSIAPWPEPSTVSYHEYKYDDMV